MKKLPLGLQNFRKVIDGDYIYVDKTRYIYDLINNASYYFLSRPRRFGKSLLIDTIAEAFSGDKELFKGLWIYDSDYSFEKHPVLRLDMSNISNNTPETLERSLVYELRRRVNEEGFTLDSDLPSDLFKHLIEELYAKYGERVVVLIDEYDKPILDHLTDLERAEANRSVIKGFYGILKSMDPYLRFVFITGVSKFTKTSVFSELNNLLDITLTKKYANICGIETGDLGKYFGEHIDYLSSLEEFKRFVYLHDEILAWYDGYSWDGLTRVINPFSLLSFFSQERFAGFWYASGTPVFLIDLIKKRPESFLTFNNLEVLEDVFDTFTIQNMQIEPLLFQTGYLTVREKSFRGALESYHLKLPNLEVADALNRNIIAEFTGKGDTVAQNAYWRINDALEAEDFQSILESLKGLFSSIPYQLHVDAEAYYHSIFYAVMSVLGFDIDAEVSTSMGRIDAVLELPDKVYVIEFKYEHCEPDAAAEAKTSLFRKALDEGMRQIESRGYADKFAGSGKKIIKAAFAFLGRDNIEMLVN